jgi:opine dehydrogenase
MNCNDRKPVFCVMGAGHGGLAMAGHLGIMGFDVRLYNRTMSRLEPVRARGGIDVVGEDVDGFGRVSLATDNAAEAIDGADVIMVVVPASGHKFMAETCAPHMKDGQIVVLNPGRTFGALEFRLTLKDHGCQADVILAETQTFIYASRIIGPAQVRIFRMKNSIALATLKAHRIPECLKVVRTAFPQFVPGDSVFKTSFNNIGSVFHPAIMMLNTGWVEDVADFEFYYQGVTESVANVLAKLDAERVAVAAALGFHATSAKDWLYNAYDAAGKSLHDAIHANLSYRGIMAPHQTEMRYITEDVPCSLVPMSSIGRKFDVKTRVMDSLIDMACAMHDRDYYAEGRTVEKLGIADLDLKQIRLMAIGEME